MGGHCTKTKYGFSRNRVKKVLIAKVKYLESRKNNPLRSTGKSINFASRYLAKVVERRAVLAQTKKIGCFIQIRTKPIG